MYGPTLIPSINWLPFVNLIERILPAYARIYVLPSNVSRNGITGIGSLGTIWAGPDGSSSNTSLHVGFRDLLKNPGPGELSDSVHDLFFQFTVRPSDSHLSTLHHV